MSTKVSTDLIDLSSNTGGLVWAKGPTAQQPASATAGEMRVDTTTNTTLVYNGTQWKTLKETAFVAPPVPTHFLVIAGGGGSAFGNVSAGGGGAGGLRTSYGSNSGGGGSAESTTDISLNTAYTITVGDGGIGVINGLGGTGGDSIFSTITSSGGGGGYGRTGLPSGNGGDGGSGGGGSGESSTSGGNGVANQGYAGGGGVFSAPSFAGGGGGGAFAIGGSATSTNGGNGGNGLPVSITGTAVTYAGGGGGGSESTSTPGSGGTGGGGSGGNDTNGGSSSGIFNTGGGAGGSGTSVSIGKNGGAGVVILRYPTANLPYFTTTGTLNTPSATDTVADAAYPVTNTAYYKLDSNANDSSGNGYNGTASNVTYGNGRFNEAANFNGSSSAINTTYTPTVANLRTVSLWFKSNATAFGVINSVSAYGVSNNYAWQWIYMLADGKVGAGYGANNGGAVFLKTTTASYNDNSWHHLALTLNGVYGVGSSVELYIDGVQVATTTDTAYSGATSAITGTFRIGHNINAGVPANIFNGSIDQVRIFSSALAAGDVEDLYNEHFPTKFTDGSDTALMFTGGTGDITFADTAPVFTPGDNFNTVLYTGNGSTQAITGTGFEPDLVWIKERSSGSSHNIADVVRGSTNYLSSNLTNAQNNLASTISSFDSNGFSVGNDGGVNQSAQTYVSWNWKAGGAARNNTDGTITSQVSANTAAGFSIVKYTGNGNNSTIGHGLSVAPDLIITKGIDSVVGNTNWLVYNSISGATGRMFLNLSLGFTIGSTAYNDTEPTSSVFTIGTTGDINGNGAAYIAYCFHSVAGYSKIGSYTGNGSATGPIVTLGFEPAFVMIKRTDATANWRILDNKRSTTNPINKELYPPLSNAEGTFSALDFLSNGFQIINTDSSYNASGGTYIYMAFATNPT